MGAIDRRPDLIETALDEIGGLLSRGHRDEAKMILAEFVEDAIDAAVADAALEQDDGRRIPLEDMLKKYGLEG